jgi:predicted nucleic acid-binding protein
LALSEFSLYSLGIILTRLEQAKSFEVFLADVIDNGQVHCLRLPPGQLRLVLANQQRFSLDFDDAHQYTVAAELDLVIISFDKDFDHTERGRKTPAQILTA